MGKEVDSDLMRKKADEGMQQLLLDLLKQAMLKQSMQEGVLQA